MPTATRVRDHCLAPGRAPEEPLAGGGYRRLFPELEPLDCEDDALHALGRAGGVCDAATAAVDPSRRPAGTVRPGRPARLQRRHRRSGRVTGTRILAAREPPR